MGVNTVHYSCAIPKNWRELDPQEWVTPEVFAAWRPVEERDPALPDWTLDEARDRLGQRLADLEDEFDKYRGSEIIPVEKRDYVLLVTHCTDSYETEAASVIRDLADFNGLLFPGPTHSIQEESWKIGQVSVDLRVSGDLPPDQLKLVFRHLAVNPPAETREEFSPLENTLAQIIWDREVWGNLAYLETLEPVLQCVDELSEATWYGVSADLGRDLACVDQVVQDGHLWARKAFGQHVLQDGVLQRVARLRIERCQAATLAATEMAK